VEVQTKNESAPAVVGEILKQMRRLRQEAVSDQELEDAKAYLKGSFPRRLETTRKIADFLSALWFFNLGDDYVDKYPAYIDAVTKDDVRRVAEKYLQPENYRLVIVGNEKQMSLTDLEPPKNIR
jgi:zinc protease